MSAGQSLQIDVVSRLRALDELSGIYDGPPARAAYPYLIVDAGIEFDWSSKTNKGREVPVALSLWDDQPARLQRLADASEAILAEAPAPVGWQLVSWRFVRRRIVRDVAGPWAAALDYRARMFALS